MIELSIKKDIIGWDYINWGKSLEYFDDHINYNNIHKVLELGADSQSSGYSLFFAKKGIQSVCSSYGKINNRLIERHKKYKLDNLISYEILDAKKITYKKEFDLICFKSMLGGICKNGNTQHAKTIFDQIHKALKPNGYLVFSENIESTIIHKFFRKNFISKSWNYFPKNELTNLMDDNFKNIKTHSIGLLGCFGRSESQKNYLGKIDEYLFNKIAPESWNYVFFGICQKASNKE